MYPIYYLLIDVSIAVSIGTFFLFLKDIEDWLEARRIAAASQQAESRYQPLKDESESMEDGDDLGPAIVEFESKKTKSASELALELRLVNDKVEELEIKTKVHRKSTTDAAIAMRDELEELLERREELQRIVNVSPTKHAAEEGEEGEEGAEKEIEITKATRSSSGTDTAVAVSKCLGPFMNTFINTCTGVFAICLYFADIISDVQVVSLLWSCKLFGWAVASCSLLVVQFLIVYLRVLPYLQNTFGSRSAIYLTFLILGFPSGLLFLDGLMFLEPFGLLAALPFPPWMKQFIPAYKATRVIAEIVIESIPQSFLQAVIYVMVVKHNLAGTASPAELAMMGEVTLMPKSILISTMASLKTWMELVQQAREAGLSVMEKALQLWNVGAGMPLDALKKGAIVEWECPYRLDRSEVSPLLDALSKNGSLVYLNMGRSGISWNAPHSDGLALVEQMAKASATLSSLRRFVLRDQGFEIPVQALRESTEALAAIRGAAFFSPNGPHREEILFMGDLLRKDSSDAHSDTVVKLLAAAHAGKMKRSTWEENVTRLMVEGTMRRGHLASLISAEALRDVGFPAQQLLDTGHTLPVMREGGYLASELRAIGLKVGTLGDGGYTPLELRIGGYKAKELKAADFTAADMKHGEDLRAPSEPPRLCPHVRNI